MSEPRRNDEQGPAHMQVFRREAEERERVMRNRVADAIREGNFRAIVRAELARDDSSLFDNIWRLELQIDQHFAATHREPPASAGTRSR